MMKHVLSDDQKRGGDKKKNIKQQVMERWKRMKRGYGQFKAQPEQTHRNITGNKIHQVGRQGEEERKNEGAGFERGAREEEKWEERLDKEEE